MDDEKIPNSDSFLQMENAGVLVECQEQQNKRIRLSVSQRKRVAAKAKRLSRALLKRCTELFTPDTVMR